ncbi:hypothetical protein C8J56DRAFT_729011, partial [Mycena floridula]
GWTPFLPSSAPSKEIPRVFAYVKKHTGVKVTLRTDIVQDRDIQVLDISAPGIDLFTVVHIYHDGTRGRQGMAWRVRSLNLPKDRPVLITGDWNLHHNRWCR